MKPYKVGSVTIDPPILLAPMEDVTNAAFRRVVKRIAKPGLMFTEFVSSMAIHHGAKKTLKKLRIYEEERPLGIQIFGAEIDVMVEAARLCEEMGADLVDINMGCWVPKVCRTGSGAALLKDPDHAQKIVESVVKSVSIPVTVKVRAGWSYELFAAPELAKRFQDSGAQMITLHARFAKQGFDGAADWDLIRRMREAITIPLVGNGDIKTGQDAITMFESTGCDGVMIGRAAISNPWTLRNVIEAVCGKPQSEPPDIRERIATALNHLDLMIEGVGDEEVAVRALRGQLPLYVKGEHGAASIRNEIVRCNTRQQIEHVFRGYEAELTSLAGARVR